MHIDKSHRSWLVLSAIVLVAGTAEYLHYTSRPTLPSGGSVIGLTYGIVASIFMLFAGLFGLRKKFRTLRIGRAQFWMRGHLWLGSLSLPLIWFHAAFHHGGPLTSTLMYLLYAIILSGLVGAILQHYLPRRMTDSVPDETIYDQIPRVLEHLSVEADDIASICGPQSTEDLATWRKDRISAIRLRAGKSLMTQDRSDQLIAAINAAPVPGCEALRDLYIKQIRPFLSDPHPHTSDLMNRSRAANLFTKRRLALPPTLQESFTDLERICDERRQLEIQRRLHTWLHGWLLIHVPLSMALLILGLWHAVVALRYL